MNAPAREHGGALDAAIERFGGRRGDWLDLSTGVNPVPYPRPALGDNVWAALPDSAALGRLLDAARIFWRVPDAAGILAAPGASALIAQLPTLRPPGAVQIAARTYNEHAAAFRAHGWTVTEDAAPARVVVHPNNPDGALWSGSRGHDFVVIDESFCDTLLDASHVARAAEPGVVVLKSFGKFWGLAGLRLGFAIGLPETLAPLAARLGPWAVSGPALAIGAAALADADWARRTRGRLARDAARLDALLLAAGTRRVGGTTLFCLHESEKAVALADRLARAHVLVRRFSVEPRWLRFGLPGTDGDWARLEAALAAGT